VSHAGACSVRESEKPARVFRADQESGDFGCAFDVESQWFGRWHFEAILAEDVRVVACLADRDGRAIGVQVDSGTKMSGNLDIIAECHRSDESWLGVLT
jgi:hypothetical protein